MSKDTISVNMNIYDIPILVEQLEKANKENERLKEEYMILQNASDEVEEEQDKEIERQKEIIRQLDIKNLELTTIIKEVREYVEKYEVINGYYDSNYDGENDTYSHDLVKEDILEILDKENTNEDN